MYKNIFYSKWDNTVHLWTDGKDGEPLYESFNYEPYAYVVDPSGDHKTLTGLSVKRTNSWSLDAEKHGLIFEHDVPIEMRILIDRYYNSDNLSDDVRVLFLDIEVEKGLRYSLPKHAQNRIISITYYYNGIYTCLLVDDNGSFSKKNNIDSVNLVVFDSERKLLEYFVKQWREISPNIVTSWNGDRFDIPYIVNRLDNIFDSKYSRLLSPINTVYKRESGKDVFVTIAGVTQMDYMVLYKKFTYTEQSSYKLDYICKLEIDKGKIEYTGTLDELYKNDIDKFIKYNINDVELMVELDKKLDFIALARSVCHTGHVSYDDFEKSSKYLEGSILTYCKRQGVVAFTTERIKQVKAKGAFVKSTKKGRYEYCYDLDLESEYPNNIKTLNISPETKWGMVVNSDFDIENFATEKNVKYVIKKFPKTHVSDILFDRDEQLNFEFDSTKDFREFLVEHSLSISSAGILYDLKKKGIVPTILDVWGETRTQYRKLAKQFHDANEYENFQYYNRKQQVQKILLNSLFGVMLLPPFRFYDRQNGESTTLTGQTLVKWSAFVGNKYYQNKMSSDVLHDYCIYSDTDSVFFESIPLIKYLYPNEYNKFDRSRMIEETLKIASDVESLINKSYSYYAKKYHNCDEHKWKIKQEMIGERAFWGSAKKRYAIKVILNNGMNVEYYDIKGFDVVRSSFPPFFRKKLKNILVDILENKDKDFLNLEIRKFKTEFSSADILDILLPTSVQEYSKFGMGELGTPIHVKSAQNYNNLLKLWKLDSYFPMDDGDKVLYCYVKKNPFGFDTIAIKGHGDDPVEILNFVEKYINKEKLFENTFLSKLDKIWEDLDWGKIQMIEDNTFF